MLNFEISGDTILNSWNLFRAFSDRVFSIPPELPRASWSSESESSFPKELLLVAVNRLCLDIQLSIVSPDLILVGRYLMDIRIVT